MSRKMSPQNAQAIVEQLILDRRRDVIQLGDRIDVLEHEYREDPHELTAAQIKRLKVRLIHYKLEVEALEIVSTK